jgi:hypothetical protein
MLKNKKTNINPTLVIGNVLVFIIAIIPFLKNNLPLWDGVILVNSIDSSNLEIAFNWFSESGMSPFNYLIKIIHILSNVINVSSHFLINIIMAISVLATYNLIFLYINILKKPEEIVQYDLILFAILFSVLPFWSLFFSPIFVHWQVPLFLCLLAVILFLKKNYFFSYFALFISFILKINIFLFIILILTYDLKSKSKFTFSLLLRNYLIPIVLFQIYSFIFVPYGLYEGYNQIKFANLLSFFNDKNVLIKIITLSPLFLIMIYWNRLIGFLYTFFCLCSIGIFYLAGKFTSVISTGYDSRFDIPLWILIYIGMYLAYTSSKLNRFFSFFLMALLIFACGGLKYRQDLFIASRVDALKTYYSPEFLNSIPKDGPVLIQPSVWTAWYEDNYHLRRALARNDVFSRETMQIMNSDVYSKLHSTDLYKMKYFLDGWQHDIQPKWLIEVKPNSKVFSIKPF